MISLRYLVCVVFAEMYINEEEANIVPRVKMEK